MTGLPITAGCDTARDQTRVCSDTSSTEMQCLKLLHHLPEGCLCALCMYGMLALPSVPFALQIYLCLPLLLADNGLCRGLPTTGHVANQNSLWEGPVGSVLFGILETSLP